jgi:hypothetical protein
MANEAEKKDTRVNPGPTPNSPKDIDIEPLSDEALQSVAGGICSLVLCSTRAQTKPK